MNSRRVKAFSLVEVLVVLLIVALLISISMTFLAQVGSFNQHYKSQQKKVDVELALAFFDADLQHSQMYSEDGLRVDFNPAYWQQSGDKAWRFPRLMIDPISQQPMMIEVRWEFATAGINRYLKGADEKDWKLSYQVDLPVEASANLLTDTLIRMVVVSQRQQQWVGVYDLAH